MEGGLPDRGSRSVGTASSLPCDGVAGMPEEEGAPGLGTPRCVKDRIEEALFDRGGLVQRGRLVFFDTTAIYFEGEGGETIGQYGHSKDHRPDLRQMVVGIALDVTAVRSAARCGRQYN